MDEQALKTIEIEMAMLVRLITSLTLDKKFGNLDRSAYLLLHQISSYEGAAGVKALSDDFRLDISTVSRQVNALEHKGYVRRMANPSDGRAYTLLITEEGTKELLEARRARIDGLKRRLKDWSDEEIESFGELLHRFNHTF